MARGSKPKKVEGPRGTVWKMTVDAGVDPATGNRKQKKLTAASKGELEKMAAQVLADVSRGTYFEPDKITVGEYLDYWLETYARPSVSSTFDSYSDTIRLHIKPALGNVPLAKLTPAHLQGYYSKALKSGRKDNKKTVGRGLSPTTVLYHHRVISDALSHAVGWEIVQRNVALSVKAPRKAKTVVNPFTAEEAHSINKGLTGTYFFAPTYLTTYTGLRLGEVLGLRWVNINLKDGYLTVKEALHRKKDGEPQMGPPKNAGSVRRIDLQPNVLAVLKAHKKAQAAEKLAAGEVYQDRGFVFAWQDGRPYDPDSFGAGWGAAARKLGVVKAHFHRLRHTAATLMLRAGVPVKDVAAMLGHSATVCADIYGHATPAGGKDAAQKLAEALGDMGG